MKQTQDQQANVHVSFVYIKFHPHFFGYSTIRIILVEM